MNVKHFKELLAFIEKLPATACDMTTWMDYTYKDNGSVITLPEMEHKGFSCGSVGCIGGWCEVYIALKADDDACFNGDWLAINPYEVYELFYEFPDNPSSDWKTWIVARLKDAIERKAIVSYKIFEASRT